MAETLLISRADIAEKYFLGKNIDDSRIDPHILRAQQSDLKALIGEYLYGDVIDNPTTPANELLLNGGQYNPLNKAGSSIYFAGLKDFLVSVTFARIEKHNDTFVTRGGNKNKNILESDKQPQKKTNDDVQGSVSDSIRIQAEILRFLDFNRADYPLWQATTTYEEKPRRTAFRITKI